MCGSWLYIVSGPPSSRMSSASRRRLPRTTCGKMGMWGMDIATGTQSPASPHLAGNLQVDSVNGGCHITPTSRIQIRGHIRFRYWASETCTISWYNLPCHTPVCSRVGCAGELTWLERPGQLCSRRATRCQRFTSDLRLPTCQGEQNPLTRVIRTHNLRCSHWLCWRRGESSL